MFTHIYINIKSTNILYLYYITSACTYAYIYKHFNMTTYTIKCIYYLQYNNVSHNTIMYAADIILTR